MEANIIIFSEYIPISLPFLLKKMRWKSERENGSSRALGWLASKTEFGTSTAGRKSNLPIRFLVVPLEASFIVFNEGINKPIIFLPQLFFSNMWTLTDQTIVLISLRSKFSNEYFAKCKMLQNDDKKECLALLHYNLEAAEDYTSDKSKSLYVLSNFEMDTNCPYKDGEMPQMRSIL